MVKCSATSKRTGKPCQKAAEPGAKVCRMHGGAAPQVKRKAAERLEATEERVKLEYARLALFDPRELYDDKGKLLPIQLLDDNTAAAIAGMEFTAKGQLARIRFVDKKGALDSVSKTLGLFKADKHEHTGPGGAPLELRVVFVKPKPDPDLEPA